MPYSTGWASTGAGRHQLVTGGSDGAAHVWDARDAELLADLATPSRDVFNATSGRNRLSLVMTRDGDASLVRCDVCGSRRGRGPGRDRVTRDLTPDETVTYLHEDPGGTATQPPTPAESPSPDAVPEPAARRRRRLCDSTEAPCACGRPPLPPARSSSPASPSTLSAPGAGRPDRRFGRDRVRERRLHHPRGCAVDVCERARRGGADRQPGGGLARVPPASVLAQAVRRPRDRGGRPSRVLGAGDQRRRVGRAHGLRRLVRVGLAGRWDVELRGCRRRRHGARRLPRQGRRACRRVRHARGPLPVSIRLTR